MSEVSEIDVHSATSSTGNRLIEARRVRRTILEQSKRANVGHIGSCLSIVHILCALYGKVLRIEDPSDKERDRFVLSKGHAALALYAVLAEIGWLPLLELDTFCGGNSLLGVHPEAELRGIDFSTGSLGHGPSMAVGAALAARLQGSPRRVFCLISDAECNEGSVWEAAMFAAHHKLDNLTIIVDWNGQQALGLTRDVLDCEGLDKRWQSFGWRTSEVDGHSVGALTEALQSDSAASRTPHVVLARTIFGKAITFMEKGVPITQSHLSVRPINWHYLPMSEVEYQLALTDSENSD